VVLGKVEEGGTLSPMRAANREGRGAAGVAAPRGGSSSLVDGGGSNEFPEHAERERGVGEEVGEMKRNEKWRLDLVLIVEWRRQR
jgi:hypothetical protein